MEGWPYYNRLQSGNNPEFQGYSGSQGSGVSGSNAASQAQQILLHHQLRQAQQQAQNYLPPSLVAAASNHNKNHNQTPPPAAPQTWKSSNANSNGLVIIPEPQKATSSR